MWIKTHKKLTMFLLAGFLDRVCYILLFLSAQATRIKDEKSKIYHSIHDMLRTTIIIIWPSNSNYTDPTVSIDIGYNRRHVSGVSLLRQEKIL